MSGLQRKNERWRWNWEKETTNKGRGIFNLAAGFPNLIVENQIPVASIDSPVPSRAAAAAPALLLFNSPCPDN